MKTEDDYTDDDIDVDDELADADEAAAEYDEDESVEEDSEVVAETDEDIADDDASESDEDDDGLEYETEDGETIAAEDEDETVASTGDDDEVDEDGGDEDEESEETATTTESRERSMADKKKTSFSDHIRNEIEKRKASGASLRGVDIIGALDKRGITVSAAQVSQLLKKAGVAPGKKGRRPKGEAAGAEAPEKSRMALKAGKRDTIETPRKIKLKPRAATTEVARSAPKTAKSGNGFNVPMDQLKAAGAFVDACGGSFKDAERILTAAAQLSQSFGG